MSDLITGVKNCYAEMAFFLKIYGEHSQQKRLNINTLHGLFVMALFLRIQSTIFLTFIRRTKKSCGMENRQL